MIQEYSSGKSDGILTALEWGQLHLSLQWVYRGKIGEGARGDFPKTCGGTAWYILRGEGRVRHNGQEDVARKGDWLIPCDGPHGRDFSGDAEILSLRFYLEWPDGQPLFSYPKGLVLKGTKHRRLLRAARILERVVYIGGGRIYSNIGFMHEKLDFAAYVEVQNSLLQWGKALHDALAQEGIRPNLERFEDRRVVRALRTLDGWPLHHTFSMNQLVRETGISRAQLDRLFTAKLGQTPHQYFNRRRLRYAERRVQATDKSIKEVAFDVGFRHVSSFSAWFKQNTGMNPNGRKEGSSAPVDHSHERPRRKLARRPRGTIESSPAL